MRIPDDQLPSRALLLESWEIKQLYVRRAAAGSWPRDEVWDGTLVLLPFVDNEHQAIKTHLTVALLECGLGTTYPGVNISDRGEDWLENFRCPDACVFLPGNQAVNHHSHLEGGPDFLVEVSSSNEPTREKLPFYASVGTREALLIDRDPWCLELYRLKRRKLAVVGRSELDRPNVLESRVMRLTLQLVAGEQRPRMLVTSPRTKKTWLV